MGKYYITNSLHIRHLAGSPILTGVHSINANIESCIAPSLYRGEGLGSGPFCAAVMQELGAWGSDARSFFGTPTTCQHPPTSNRYTRPCPTHPHSLFHPDTFQRGIWMTDIYIHKCFVKDKNSPKLSVNWIQDTQC